MTTSLQISSMEASSPHRLRVMTAMALLRSRLSLPLIVTALPKLRLSLTVMTVLSLCQLLIVTALPRPRLSQLLTVMAPPRLTPSVMTTTPPTLAPSQAALCPPLALVWTPLCRASYPRSAETLQTSLYQSPPKPSKIPTTMIPLIIKTRLAGVSLKGTEHFSPDYTDFKDFIHPN